MGGPRIYIQSKSEKCEQAGIFFFNKHFLKQPSQL